MANLPGDAAIAEPARTIQALDRGLRLLTLIAESPRPLSRSEAARLAGLNPSTSFRLLATLEAHDLIERVPWASATAAASRRCYSHPAASRRPSAATHGRCSRCCATQPARARSSAPRRHELRAARTGRRHPFAVGALDRAELPAALQLARQAPARRHERGRARRLPGAAARGLYPAHADRPSSAIRAELDEVRATGIATSIGDHELGVNGISAAARDGAGRPVAIVSVTGPDVRLRRRGWTPSRRSSAARPNSSPAHST